MKKKCLHIYFSGRVQGVGFRFTARYLAGKFGVTGWVMNLPDLRVELFCCGVKDSLDKFIFSLKEEFKSYIDSTDILEVDTKEFPDNFSIRFPSY